MGCDELWLTGMSGKRCLKEMRVGLESERHFRSQRQGWEESGIQVLVPQRRFQNVDLMI